MLFNDIEQLDNTDFKMVNDDKIFSSMSVYNNNTKNLAGSFVTRLNEDLTYKAVNEDILETTPNPRSAYNATPITRKTDKTNDNKSIVTVIEKNISTSQIPYENQMHYREQNLIQRESHVTNESRYV